MSQIEVCMQDHFLQLIVAEWHLSTEYLQIFMLSLFNYYRVIDLQKVPKSRDAQPYAEEYELPSQNHLTLVHTVHTNIAMAIYNSHAE